MRVNNKSIIIASAMTFSFVADVVQHSLAKSDKGKFKLHFPMGKGLLVILGIVLVEAIAIDWAVDRLEHSLATEEENKLKAFAEKEKERVRSGDIKDKPVQIVWQ